MMTRLATVLFAILFTVACSDMPNTSPTMPTTPTTLTAPASVGVTNFTPNAVGGGFDQYGYNRTARIFNGTGSSWCLARGAAANCLGINSPDKLVMKWNAEWDRGNTEGWNDPNGYRAWENNEWNGNCANCSGQVWHYKIQWIGACGADGTLLSDGGYCIWGVFEVLMDQGQDPNLGHLWFAKAKPNGYGS